MQTPADYLARTESAVRHLFAGIDAYMVVLKTATSPMFMTSTPYGPAHDAEFARWISENAEKLDAARAAQVQFVTESFAMDTLCGAVLQVAEKAIEIYGTNSVLSTGLPSAVKPRIAKFCVGRQVRTLPLGLVVYAARNQHTHFNDAALNEPGASIFRRLATVSATDDGQALIDPAFDLQNPRLTSLASNVTALLGWRSFACYDTDMRQLLGV